jgi:predicted DNA-binding ArsR family transcriptional regulator
MIAEDIDHVSLHLGEAQDALAQLILYVRFLRKEKVAASLEKVMKTVEDAQSLLRDIKKKLA